MHQRVKWNYQNHLYKLGIEESSHIQTVILCVMDLPITYHILNLLVPGILCCAHNCGLRHEFSC